jgi:hypothetical protein
MTEPAGTYISRVSEGCMQLPGAIADYAFAEGWTLFRFVVIDKDHVRIRPVMPDERTDFHASLEPNGRLWIPAELREQVQLGEQSVMLRVEHGAINMYLRKVFETLGFRPS